MAEFNLVPTEVKRRRNTRFWFKIYLILTVLLVFGNYAWYFQISKRYPVKDNELIKNNLKDLQSDRSVIESKLLSCQNLLEDSKNRLTHKMFISDFMVSISKESQRRVWFKSISVNVDQKNYVIDGWCVDIEKLFQFESVFKEIPMLEDYKISTEDVEIDGKKVKLFSINGSLKIAR